MALILSGGGEDIAMLPVYLKNGVTSGQVYYTNNEMRVLATKNGTVTASGSLGSGFSMSNGTSTVTALNTPLAFSIGDTITFKQSAPVNTSGEEVTLTWSFL